MGKLSKDQRGFTIVEVMLVLIFLGIVGFAGYYAMHSRSTNKQLASNNAKTTSKTAAVNTSKSNAAEKYINLAHSDDSVTQVTAASITKTADQLGVLDAIHAWCPSNANYVDAVEVSDPNSYLQDGNYALVNTSCETAITNVNDGADSGKATYVRKDSRGVWVVDLATQDIPNCESVDGKGYPKTVLPSCYDTSSESERAPQ